MSDEISEDHIWGSTLEEHPDYVKTIGMVSIENSNLENTLSDLFSCVISVPLRTGYAIFMTPKSAMAQIEILEKAAIAMFKPRRNHIGDQRERLQKALTKTLKIVSKARSVVGKRHGIIHDGWGIDHGKVVRYTRASPTLESRPVLLNELTMLVKEYRKLIRDAGELSAEFRKHHPRFVDMKL